MAGASAPSGAGRRSPAGGENCYGGRLGVRRRQDAVTGDLTMAQVAAAAFIRAPLDRVYGLAKDVEAFPTFMPDVESIRVLERKGNHTFTVWGGVVDDRRVRCVEDAARADARHRCNLP